MEKQGSGAWGMRDQGTYAPTDGLNRWMPSAAMDKSGNIAVGYSTSNGTAPNYPSIRYATRLATDPPGELGSEETIMRRHGLADRHREPLGRLLEHVRRSRRRLHLLLRDGVHPDHRRNDLAHPHRQVHDPDVRTAADPASAAAAAPASASAAAASASNGRLRDHDRRRDDHPGHQDLGIHCDDCYRPVTFPFPVRFYNTTFNAANVSSNGVVNFSGENLQYANGCLPARVEGRALIVLWDDMDTRPSGRGVFTALVGSAPNRQFIIRFAMNYLSGGGTVNAEAIFTEGSDNIQVIYGTATQGGSSSTEGVQAAGANANFTEFGCNESSRDAESAPELRLFRPGAASTTTAASTTSATTTATASASTATTSAATSTTSAATASTTATTGALPRAEGGRTEALNGEGEDPQSTLLRGPHPPRPLQASRPGPPPEPEARRLQASPLPGQARRRPPLAPGTAADPRGLASAP